MDSVGTYEAKTRFTELLRHVAQGKSILITRHGVPVARLMPPAEQPALSPQEAIQQLRMNRKGLRLKGLSIRKMIEEGRR